MQGARGRGTNEGGVTNGCFLGTPLYVRPSHWTLCTSVHLRESPYISVHLCASPCISVYLCASLCISVHLCASLCISVHLCASPCISVHLRASPCISVHLRASLCISVHLRASPCISVHLCASPCISVHLCASLCISLMHILRALCGTQPSTCQGSTMWIHMTCAHVHFVPVHIVYATCCCTMLFNMLYICYMLY